MLCSLPSYPPLNNWWPPVCIILINLEEKIYYENHMTNFFIYALKHAN